MNYARPAILTLAIVCLSFAALPQRPARALDLVNTSTVVTTTNTYARELENIPGQRNIQTLVYTMPGVAATTEVYSSVSVNGGTDWEPGINISLDDIPSFQITTASSGDNVYAGWEGYDPAIPNDVAFFGRSANNGQTWAAPVRLSGDTGGGGITLATISDELFAVYKTDGGAAPGDLNVRRSSNFGQEFEAAIKIGENVTSAQAAATDTDLFVAYLAAGGPGVRYFPGGDLNAGVNSEFDLDAIAYRIDITPENQPVITMLGSYQGGPNSIFQAYRQNEFWQLKSIYEQPAGTLAISLPDVTFSSTRTFFSWTNLFADEPPSVGLASMLRVTLDVSAALEFREPDEAYVDPSVLANGDRMYVAMTAYPEGAQFGEEAIEIWGLPANGTLPTTTEELPYAGTVGGAALPDLNPCDFGMQRAGGIFDDFFDICMTYVEFANQGAQVTVKFTRGNDPGRRRLHTSQHQCGRRPSNPARGRRPAGAALQPFEGREL